MYKKIYRYMKFLSMFTLILCTLLVSSVSFSIFDKSIKDEIKTEAKIMKELLNNSLNSENLFDEIGVKNEDKSFTVLASDKKIIYDSENRQDIVFGKEIENAIKTGVGEAQKYYFTLTKNEYYYALKLDNGNILRISTTISNGIFVFKNVLFALLFMLVLIYILCVNVASALTKNIIAPLESLYSFDGEVYTETYPELQPFFNRIIGQNKEIRRQMEKSRLRKLRLQLISDNMNEGLIILDKNANVLSYNECVLDILSCEMPTKETLQKDEILWGAVKEAFEKKKSSTVWGKEENTYRVFYSPVCENDDLMGVMLLFFDITEIEQAQRIRKEFSANVSHELKTPLTAIRGYAQMINSDIAKKEDIKDFTGRIEKESIRLINLIDDIMKLSKLDENIADENIKKEISLMGVCEEVYESLKDEASKKDISFILKGTDFVIYANPSQIVQIVYNLCDNAIKYNVTKGKVEVVVSEGKLVVKDTGIGIPKDATARIFERFFRVDKSHSKKVNGTGLGLSIVKHAAILNNADIKVESELGKGAVFTVTFNSENKKGSEKSEC